MQHFTHDVKIDIPNIKNIIISNNGYVVQKLYLTSLNAITCQFIDIRVVDLILAIPCCSEIIISNSRSKIYNPNIF
jgi:hypothetical protein